MVTFPPMRLFHPNNRGRGGVGRKLAGLALSFSVGVLAAKSAEASSLAQPAPPEPSVFDRVWSAAELYKSDSNPVVQRVQFTGRFHLDYAVQDADQGDLQDWNIRRLRLGAKVKLFGDYLFHGEVELNPQNPDPLYSRLTDMHLSWSRSKKFVATVGKHGAPFTLDGSTSSKELLTTERSNVANNLWFSNQYFPGVSVSGQIDQWRYRAAIHSSGAGNREFGEFNGGVFGLVSGGYDFAKAWNAEQALLAVSYVENEPNINNTWTRSLRRVGSINFSYEATKWGVRADLSAGDGYLGASDLWGATLMPFYNITERVQVVARVTHVASDDPNGVRPALYGSRVVSARGDEYNEAYLGLNYYVYGHKLKLQTGVQYAEMADSARDGGQYAGWGWTTALRMYW